MEPSAHVHGLFLAPDDFGVGIALELPSDEIPRERRELLDSANLHRVEFRRFLSTFVEIVIHLTRAEDDAFDLVFDWRVHATRSARFIHNHALETNSLQRIVVVAVIKLVEV